MLLFVILMAGGRWSVVGGRWSVVGGRWSVVGGRWSGVGCRESGVGSRRSRLSAWVFQHLLRIRQSVVRVIYLQLRPGSVRTVINDEIHASGLGLGWKQDSVQSRGHDIVGHIPSRWLYTPAKPLSTPVNLVIRPYRGPLTRIKSRTQICHLQTIDEKCTDCPRRQPRILPPILSQCRRLVARKVKRLLTRPIEPPATSCCTHPRMRNACIGWHDHAVPGRKRFAVNRGFDHPAAPPANDSR